MANYDHQTEYKRKIPYEDIIRSKDDGGSFIEMHNKRIKVGQSLRDDFIAEFKSMCYNNYDYSKFIAAGTVIKADDDKMIAYERSWTKRRYPTYEEFITKGEKYKKCQKQLACVEQYAPHNMQFYMATEGWIMSGWDGLTVIPALTKYVPKDGYCYVTILWALTYYVLDEDHEAYLAICKSTINVCGQNPIFERFILEFVLSLHSMPYLLVCPIPSLWLSHDRKNIHVIDQRGAVKMTHQLYACKLSDLAYWYVMNNKDNRFRYTIGMYQDEGSTDIVNTNILMSLMAIIKDSIKHQEESIIQHLRDFIHNDIRDLTSAINATNQNLTIMERQRINPRADLIPRRFRDLVSTWLGEQFVKLDHEQWVESVGIERNSIHLNWEQQSDIEEALKIMLSKPIESWKKTDIEVDADLRDITYSPKMTSMVMTSIGNQSYTLHGSLNTQSIPVINGYVPTYGYCYLTLFITLSQQIHSNDEDTFIKCVRAIQSQLGKQPKLEHLVKSLIWLTKKIPYLREAPIPMITMHKNKKIAHVCDQRGRPRDHLILKCYTVQQLVELVVNSALVLGYVQVAGIIKDEIKHDIWDEVIEDEKTEQKLFKKIKNHMGVLGISKEALLSFAPKMDDYKDETMERFEIVRFYRDNIKKIKDKWWQWLKNGTLIKDMKSDPELCAFILLSPATLWKLQKIIVKETRGFQQLQILAEGASDTLSLMRMLQCLIKGTNIKLSSNVVDRVHLTAWELIDDQIFNDNRLNRIKEITEIHKVACGNNKTMVNSLEELCHTQSFMSYVAIEFKKDGLFYLQLKMLPQYAWTRISGTWVEDGIISNIKQEITQAINRTSTYITKMKWNVSAIIFKFLSIAYSLYTICYGFKLVNWIVFFGCKMLFKHMKFRLNQQRILLCAISVLICVIYTFRTLRIDKKEDEKKREYQSKPNSVGTITSIMATAILIVYTFDMNAADMVVSAFSRVSKLATLLIAYDTTKDTRRFEADDILDLEIELLEEEKQEPLLRVSPTFEQWLAAKQTNDEDITRPLEYGTESGEVFILNAGDAAEVAARATMTKQQWNFVIGATGTGKSTIFPIGYYNTLQNLTARKRRILILEPTRASTELIAQQINALTPQNVTVKYKGMRQIGMQGVQVMTYGSALFTQMSDETFISQFDAVFLDESHLISEHSLAIESILNKYKDIRKFYISATPRVKQVPHDLSRRFHIKEIEIDGKDPQAWISVIGSGTMTDPLIYGRTTLVFVTGRKETTTLAAAVMNKHPNIISVGVNGDNWSTAKGKMLNALEQKDRPVIIFATNVVETGVTLDVDTVVDFGFNMEPTLNLGEKCLSLSKKRITKNKRIQRIGRCGRLRDGVAIMFGKVRSNESIMTPDIVYQAALFSFLLDTDLYINNQIDLSWLAGITRDQCKTMLMIGLPPFVTRDLVDTDGTILRDVYDVIKKYGEDGITADVHDKPIKSEVFKTWPTIRDVLIKDNKGDIPDEQREHQHKVVPFICETLGADFHVDLAKALWASRPTLKKILQGKGEVSRRITIKLNPANTQRDLSILTSLQQSNQKVLNNIAQFKSNITHGFMASCYNQTKAIAQANARARIAQRNLDTIIRAKTQIQELQARGEEEFEINQSDYYEAAMLLEYQSDEGNETDIKKKLEIEDITIMTIKDLILDGDKKKIIIVISILIFTLVGYAICLTWDKRKNIFKLFREETQERTFEMKKKYANRDKRNDQMIDDYGQDIVDNYFNDSTIEERKRVVARKGKKVLNDYLQHLTRDKLPFYVFYDIASDDAVELAILKYGSGEEVFRTNRPIETIEEATKELEKRNGSATRGITIGNQSWADIAEDEEVYYEIKLKNGRTVRCNVTPHRSAQTSITGSLMGYTDKDGTLRQTGRTRVLEAASDTPYSRVNFDVTKMIIKVMRENTSNHFLHIISYHDWLIAPAHLLLEPTNIFEIEENGIRGKLVINEIYFEEGFDIVLIKRPINIMRRKLYTTIKEQVDPSEVTMIHWSNRLGKYTQTASRMSSQMRKFKNRWSHTISTAKGMCGAPVIEINSGHIVGIHSVGDPVSRINEYQGFNKDFEEILKGKKVVETQPWRRLTSTEIGINIGMTMEYQMKIRVPLLHTHSQPIEQYEDDYRTNPISEERLVEVEEGDSAWYARLKLHEGRIKSLTPQEHPIGLLYSRDTSMYTIENFKQYASAGGRLKIKELQFKKGYNGKAGMEIIGWAPSHIVDCHKRLRMSEPWRLFKATNPDLIKEIEHLENQFKPSALNEEAYWKDISKYAHPLRATANLEVLKEAVNYTIKILKKNGLENCRIRDTEEVLADVQWTTAAGAMYGCTKDVLLQYKTEDEIKEIATWSKEELLNGRNAGIWNGSLKAELRPNEKVDANKTRTFTAAPITTLLASKYYVDDFNHKFYESHLRAPHTVGINKFYKGWEKLYYFLKQENCLWGGGDGTRYDSSIEPYLFDVVIMIRLACTKEDNVDEMKQALFHLYREIVNTPILTINGDIVMKRLGNPSGQASTVVDNTLILITSFTYAIFSKFGINLGTKYLDEGLFKFVCNGDDNKFTVDKSIAPNNIFDMSKELLEIGLEYKFDELSEDPNQQYYMSLQFIDTRYGVGFSLDDDRLVAIAQWTKGSCYTDILQGAQAALIESYNKPWLFKIFRHYIIWFCIQYHNELQGESDIHGGTLRLLSIKEICDLHYGTFEEQEVRMENFENEQEVDTILINRQFQMDTGEELGYISEPTGPSRPVRQAESTQPPSGGVIDTGPGTVSTWRLGTLDIADIENALVPKLYGLPAIATSVIKGAPVEYLHFDNQIAEQPQIKEWKDKVRRAFGGSGSPLSEEHFDHLLVAFILWCADNGTSDQLDISQKMEVYESPNKFKEIPIKPFIQAAQKVGLRKIMRFFAPIAITLLERRGTMSKWGVKRGFTQTGMIPYAFDFIQENMTIPKGVRETQTQAKAAALGNKVRRALLTDGNVGGGTSYERHVVGDVNETTHATLDNTPVI